VFGFELTCMLPVLNSTTVEEVMTQAAWAMNDGTIWLIVIKC
jgi:hypothetical protein